MLKKETELTESARTWIHGMRDELTENEKDTVTSAMERFAEEWMSHGKPVSAAFKILHNRFLVMSAECPGGMSGCSIDGYFRSLRALEEELGIDFLNGNLVFHQTPTDDSILATEHLDFFELVKKGEVGPDTVVFDTLINRLGDLQSARFTRRFKDSWHFGTYGG